MLAGAGLQPRPTKPAGGPTGLARGQGRGAEDGEGRGRRARIGARGKARRSRARCDTQQRLRLRRKTTNYRNMAADSRRRGAHWEDGGRGRADAGARSTEAVGPPNAASE